MRCSVVYALPERQWLWRVELDVGATVADALRAAREQARAAGSAERGAVDFPTIPWDTADVGIFGELCGREALLSDGDRVEIYRPLAMDPKEGRRARARRLRG